MRTSKPDAAHWFWLFWLGSNFGKYQYACGSLSGVMIGFEPPWSFIGSVPARSRGR